MSKKNGWKEFLVKDLIEAGHAETKTGPFGTQLKASSYVDSGTPVINVRNIGFGNVRPEKLEFIGPDTVERLSTHLLLEEDIVFGRKGAVERHAFIRPDQRHWFQGSDCLRLRFNANDLVLPRFVSYFLLTEQHKSWMMNQCSHGATMASLNQDIIARIPLRLPPLPTQRKIASVLSAYDDLIENNTRRIAILEEMAQAIYREWFVNFRFPGHENVKLVDSPLGQIPEGWERTTLGLVSSNFDRIRVPLSSKQRATRKGPYPYYGASGVIDSVDDYLFDGKYVLVAEDGENINSRKLPIAFLAYGQFWVNNHAHILQGKAPVSTEFLLTTLTDTDVKPYVTGAAQPKINQANLNRIPVMLPDEVTLSAFDNAVLPCFDERQLLIKKNTNLRTTRDLLLPKLISGQLDVEDLDIDVGEPLEELAEATA